MFTIPNILTLCRLVLIPVFLTASIDGHYTLAFAIFVGAALTDILDGFIARRMNQRSRIGAFLDPAADKIMMVSGYLYYTLRSGVSVRIPGWLMFTVFIRDVLIVVFAYLLYTRVQVKKFPPSPAGKASTVLQAVTLAATIASNAFLAHQLWVAQFFFRLALVVTLFSAFDYLRRGKRLLEAHLEEVARSRGFEVTG